MEATMDQFPTEIDSEPSLRGSDLIEDSIDATSYENLSPLPNDENERLIALCEAPALLWLREPAQARAPEPFGMIA